MNEAAFLSALRDDPADELSWLALADWLDDGGQARRAELVRLTRRLLGRPDGRPALERRLVELLRAGVRPAVPEMVNALGMRFALVPAGRFLMGPQETSGATLDVTLTRPFYLGVFAVTQAQYRRVMGIDRSHCGAGGGGKASVAGLDTSDFPAEMVSWEDASAFCRRMGEADGRAYRLPTEAEWEYACRAGTTTAFYFGDELTTADANFGGPTPHGQEGTGGPGRTCPVGSYPPNAFGLYDMHGNVFTWCADWVEDYPDGAATDPTGPASGRGRAIRGGGWATASHHCRAANRGTNDADYRGYQNGVRVALGAR